MPPPPPPSPTYPKSPTSPAQPSTPTGAAAANKPAQGTPVQKPNTAVTGADGQRQANNPPGGGLIKRAKSKTIAAAEGHGYGAPGKGNISTPAVVKGSVRPGALHNFKGRKVLLILYLDNNLFLPTN